MKDLILPIICLLLGLLWGYTIKNLELKGQVIMPMSTYIDQMEQSFKSGYDFPRLKEK